MRNSALLRALFPTSRADILAACMLQPDRWWYLTELAAHLSTGPSSLQRDLSSLTHVGILEQRRDGRRVYVKANIDAPVFPEIRGLIQKTTGILPALQLLLEPFRDKILCAFVFGSVARIAEHAASDVDLMVIGSIGMMELSPALRKIERHVGREINATVFGRQEFRSKAKDHFLAAILHESKQFLIGDERILGDIVGEQRRTKAQHLKERAG